MDIVSVHSDTCRYVHCMLKMTLPAQFVPAAAARIPIYCRVLFDVFFLSFIGRFYSARSNAATSPDWIAGILCLIFS